MSDMRFGVMQQKRQVGQRNSCIGSHSAQCDHCEKSDIGIFIFKCLAKTGHYAKCETVNSSKEVGGRPANVGVWMVHAVKQDIYRGGAAQYIFGLLADSFRFSICM